MILGIALCWVFAITMFVVVKYFWWKNNGDEDDKQYRCISSAIHRSYPASSKYVFLEVVYSCLYLGNCYFF